MRLLYIHQYFTVPEGSGSTRSYDLSKKFVENGIEVIMLTSTSNFKDREFHNRWTYLERDGIKLWALKSEYNHKMSIPRRILSFLRFVLFTSLKLLKLKGDIVLATSTPLTVAFPALFKKMISKTPFIFEVRDVWPEGPIQQGYVKNKLVINYLRRLEKSIYNNASYVVPLSIGMKSDILSRVIVQNIEVIPNICEIDRFQNFTKSIELGIDLSNRKTVLYAGTLGPVNDIMYVARLAEKMLVINPQIAFLIIGDGKQKVEIVNYCEEKGILNNNIYFLDPISKESLPYVYNQVTMGSSFVWDYKIKWDNSANKFFDTLAAGRPILINYQGWQADVIKEKECGYVLPNIINERDIINFSNYLMDEQKLIQHGHNALITAEEYSLDKAVTKYLKVFESVTQLNLNYGGA